MYVSIMNCESESSLETPDNTEEWLTLLFCMNIPECKAVDKVFVIFLATMQTLR
jgi:hypothetical protein